MDALTLLMTDHRKVDSLFAEYKTATGPETKKELVDTMSKELSIHAAIEETEFYPEVQQKLPEGKSLVDESLHEHQGVKETLAKLERMQPADAAFASEVEHLMSEVKHHVDEEEHEMFPKIRSAFSADHLMELGEKLEKAKSKAPTHPHPAAPSAGMGAKVAGMSAGMMDRARDAMGGRKDEQTVREDVMEERQQRRP